MTRYTEKNKTKKTDTLGYAKDYVSEGFSVIPLEPKGKKPALASWKEFQARKPKDQELKKWFCDADKNIGIVTGKVSGIVVVDIDTDEAAIFAKENLPETRRVKTGKGVHLYYRYPQGAEIRNFQRRDDLPGIDLRADGGYVVAPPSIHESGDGYYWVNPDQPLADFPEDILPLNQQRKTQLKELYEGVEEGERNTSLTKLIGSFINDGATIEESIEMAKIWNSNNKPPLPDEELHKTVKSIYRRHEHESSHRLIPMHKGQQDNRAYQWSTDNQSCSVDYNDVNLNEILVSGKKLIELDIQIRWLLYGLIPEKSITILHGSGGIGKTWLTLMLSHCVSFGIPFLGQDTNRSRVVYVDFENSLAVLAARVKILNCERVRFWHNSDELPPPKLDSNNWHVYKKLRPCLLIFDTLRAAQSRDENNSQDMASIMSKLKELRDIGHTILVLHHTPKGNDRIYKGSTAILDLADHVLSLHKVKKGTHKETDSDDDDTHYRFGTKEKTRYEPFHMFLEFDKDKKFVRVENPDDKILREIHGLIKNREQLNQSSIFELVKDELHITSKGRLTKLLKKGEGVYWNSQKANVGRDVFYSPIVLNGIEEDNGTTHRTRRRLKLIENELNDGDHINKGLEIVAASNNCNVECPPITPERSGDSKKSITRKRLSANKGEPDPKHFVKHKVINCQNFKRVIAYES